MHLYSYVHPHSICYCFPKLLQTMQQLFFLSFSIHLEKSYFLFIYRFALSVTYRIIASNHESSVMSFYIFLFRCFQYKGVWSKISSILQCSFTACVAVWVFSISLVRTLFVSRNHCNVNIVFGNRNKALI